MSSQLPSSKRKKRSPTSPRKRSEEAIKTPPLTRFERARIIGARALQIAMGALPLVKPPPNVTDPVKIAELELEKGMLPFVIERETPGGLRVEVPLPRKGKRPKSLKSSQYE
jgi:DNA-directed RNA polymerase subunit K/omega